MCSTRQFDWSLTVMMTGVHLSMESGVMRFVKKEKGAYRTDLQTTCGIQRSKLSTSMRFLFGSRFQYSARSIRKDVFMLMQGMERAESTRAIRGLQPMPTVPLMSQCHGLLGRILFYLTSRFFIPHPTGSVRRVRIQSGSFESGFLVFCVRNGP